MTQVDPIHPPAIDSPMPGVRSRNKVSRLASQTIDPGRDDPSPSSVNSSPMPVARNRNKVVRLRQRSDSGRDDPLLANQSIASAVSTVLQPGKDPLVDWLVKNQYTHIAVELNRSSHFDLRGSYAPILLEQLVILDRALDKQPLGNAIAKTVIEGILASLPAMELNEDANKDPKIIDAVEKLGLLTFWIEHDPSLINPFLETKSFEEFEKAYRKKVDGIKVHVKELEQFYKNNGVQNGYGCMTVSVARIIGLDLVTQGGFVNIGMIIFWYNKYSPEAKTGVGKTLFLRLNEFHHSALARHQIKAMKIQTENGPIHKVVRISLGIPNSAPLTDHHARVVAMIAAISHFRQTPSYTCFSHVICISQLANNLNKALEDFHHLLSESRLLRKIGNFVREFPFLVSSPNKALDVNVEWDEEMRIGKDKIFLWELPGLMAACLAMDVPCKKETFSIFSNKSNSTIRSLIQGLAQNNDEHFRTGCFAFESLTNNPFISIWSNCIASMAEAKTKGLIKSQLFDTVIWELDVNFQGLDEHLYLKEELEREIIKRLMTHLHFNYDPFLSGYHTYKGPLKRDGGFVLYERNRTIPSYLWTRIDNGQAFQTLISKIVAESIESVIASQKDAQASVLATKMGKYLCQYVMSDQFLNRVLQHYSTLLVLPGVTQTPWMFVGGNDTENTLSVYHEKPRGVKAHKIKSTNAEELLRKFIELGKQNKEQVVFLDNSIVPGRIVGSHAFCLILGHWSLKKIWENNKNSEEWASYMKSEGMEIADTPLTIETTAKIYTNICAKLWSKSTKNQKLFQEDVAKLPNNLTIFQLNQELQKLAKKIDPLRDIGGIIETLIIQTLPNEIKKRLIDSTFHIVDSNWTCETTDLHFCLFCNPCSKEIVLWRICDDNSNYNFLNQNEWVNDKEWEIFI